MKIIYCTLELHMSGGIGRILSTKANYLTEVLGHEVVIITTDQNDHTPYYALSNKIKQYDLKINYFELNQYNFFTRLITQIKKRKTHQKRLTEILKKEKANIVISTYENEFTFLHKIQDGSKKIAEIHFSKQSIILDTKHNKQRPFFTRLFSYLASKRKYSHIKYYEKFVVLTQKDKKEWSNYPNIVSINNALPFYPEKVSYLDSCKVISVGRLAAQKQYDLLIKAWGIVNEDYPEWELDIFGSGECYDKLSQLIQSMGMENIIRLNSPHPNIIENYLNSSIYVMSSLYEGFPMVLLEAQACGLPCVSFNCPHGPAEIINNEEDGFIVEEGNCKALAEKIKLLMKNDLKRKEMGQKARNNVKRFMPENIMKQWNDLFLNITRK